jgi:hypothetical protein
MGFLLTATHRYSQKLQHLSGILAKPPSIIKTPKNLSGRLRRGPGNSDKLFK